jgi:hypothetical protein
MSTGSGHVNRFWPCQQVLAMSTGSVRLELLPSSVAY